MSYTVVGARGFIGSAFVRALRARGESVIEMTHDEARAAAGDLGNVIYASGVAWDANKQVDLAVDAHVAVPLELLRKRIRSLTYISSTRIYGDAPSTVETTPARVPGNDVYSATKAAGEAAILADSRPELRIVRLSNVYGLSFRSGLMLSDFLRQAATTGRISVRSAPESEKDHVSVDDVADMTLEIARSGRQRVYNIAAGFNTRQGDILSAIAAASGCEVCVEPNAPVVRFAPIDIERVRSEFNVTPRRVVDDIPALWRGFAEHFGMHAGAAR